ncbi:hypothetical protein V8E51_015285 [Hyaloscypha variabilis]
MAAPLSQDGNSELHDLSLDHINDETLPQPQPQPPSNARLTTSATVDFERHLGLDSYIYEEVKNESSKDFGKIFFLGYFGLNESNESHIYEWSVLQRNLATSLRELSHSIHRAVILMMDETNQLNRRRRFALSCVAFDPDPSIQIFSHFTPVRRADVAWRPGVFAARLILKMLSSYGHLDGSNLDPPVYTLQRRNTVWLAWEPDNTYPRASVVVSSIKMLAKIRGSTMNTRFHDGTYQTSDLNYDEKLFASLVTVLFFLVNSSAIEFLKTSFHQISNIRTKARYYTGRSKYVYLTELREVIANNRDELARTKKALPIWANRACAAGWARIGANVLKDLENVEGKMKELHEFVIEIADEVKALHEFHTGQFAMVLTALAIIYVPFGAVTSCYGVNALEFVDGAYTHIRTVWEVAASVTVASLGVPLFGLLALSSVVYATQQGILMTILDWPGITRFCFGLLVFCMVIIHAVLGVFLRVFFRKWTRLEPVVVNAILAALELAMAAQLKTRHPRNRSYLVWMAGFVTAVVCSGLGRFDHSEATFIIPWIIPLCLGVLSSWKPSILCQ